MYKLYCDGGGQTVKNKVYPTYFSYKLFKDNREYTEIVKLKFFSKDVTVVETPVRLERWFLKSLITPEYYNSGQLNDELMLPKGCSILNELGKETNIISEYAAIYYSLQRFQKVLGNTPLIVCSDSEVCIKQIAGVTKGGYACNAKHLRFWRDGVLNLLWDDVIFEYTKRDKIVEMLGH